MGNKAASGFGKAIAWLHSPVWAWCMAALLIALHVQSGQPFSGAVRLAWIAAQALFICTVGSALARVTLAGLRRRQFSEAVLVAGPSLLFVTGCLLLPLSMNKGPLIIVGATTAAMFLTQQRIYGPFVRLIEPENAEKRDTGGTGGPSASVEGGAETEAAREDGARSIGGSEKAVRVLCWIGITLAALAPTLWYFLPLHRVSWVERSGSWATPGLIDGASALQQGLCAALAVLAVLSPFALRTSVPLVMEAVREAGRKRSIYYRDDAAIRGLGEATTVVFAMTGTLTEGRPTVILAETAGKASTKEVLSRAARGLANSGHALADAVLEACRHEDITVETGAKAVLLPGLGVLMEDGDTTVLVGRPRLLRERGVDLAAFEDTVARFQTEGKLVLMVAAEGRALGVIAFHDPLRRDSVRVSRTLRALGIRTALLAGEDKLLAGVLAEQAGLDQVVADVLPENRGHALAQLRSETIGGTVFVSASAEENATWQQAEAGVAMCPEPETGPREASVTLSNKELLAVPRTIVLSRRALSTIVENAAWLTAYHVAAAPLAMLGFIHPAAAVGLSTLAWAAAWWNARRLLRFDPDALARKVVERMARGGMS